MNCLLFGDNLKWLRDAKVFPDAGVDLVYLDPPFNSNADYNVLFREASGAASQAQFHAFTDTWNWADAAQTYADFVDHCPHTAVVEMVEALHSFLKNSPMMAYLAMMAPRLVELHRVLKPTGSLYLHCDPTASHYLRMLLDGIFGSKNFRTEIVWKRSSAHSDTKQGRKQHGRIHDVILFYSKSDDWKWNPTFMPYDEEYVETFYNRTEAKTGRKYRLSDLTAAKPGGDVSYEFHGTYPYKGRFWAYSKANMEKFFAEGRLEFPKSGGPPQFKRYLDEMPGVALQDLWTDIKPIHAISGERLGYPTQKPQELLERILETSSNKGDIVLDPFCGCGTTIHAAQKLGRQWIGIDVTYLAINLIKNRLESAFGKRAQFAERGQPTDFASAKALAELDKWQFEQWALSLVKTSSFKEGEGRGADRGVDGHIYFYDCDDSRSRREEAHSKKENQSLVTSTPTKSKKEETLRRKILVQVKGGGVKRSDVATLLGDVNNQKFAGGVLITLEKPSKPMREEAADAGRYESKLWQNSYPKIQILTVEGLMNQTERLDAPPRTNPFAKAEIEAGEQPRQIGLID